MLSSKRLQISAVSIIILIFLVFFMFIGFKSRSSRLTVGVILPLTGQYGSLGQSIRQSMEMSDSGLGDKKINLIFEDDQYDSKDGLSAYHKLTDIDRASIIIAISSPTVEIVKPEIAKTNQLMFILGDELVHERDRVFQLMPQGAGLFDELGRQAGKHYHSVAVVYASDNQLFKTNHDLFIGGLPADVRVQSFPILSNSDVRTEASQIALSKADVFTLFVPVETGIKLLKELNKYENKPKLVCDMDIELSIGQYITDVGPRAFNGCISVAMADTKTASFVSSYKAKFGTDPQFASDYGFDAVQIIGKLSGLNNDSRLKVLNDSFKYKGVSGMISFDETGTRPSVSELDIFKYGKFEKMAE